MLPYQRSMKAHNKVLREEKAIDRAKEYISKFVNKGGIFAIEHTENDVYMIGSTFESLIEDFSWQHCAGFNNKDATKAEVNHILNTLDNYCLDENETGFYENVEAAITETLETI
jgi:hypothetical protein